MVEPPVALTINQTALNVANVSIALLATNPNRKYIFIRNFSDRSEPVFIHFGIGTATSSNGLPLSTGEIYEFPKGFIYTGAIFAVSTTTNPKGIAIMEGS